MKWRQWLTMFMLTGYLGCGLNYLKKPEEIKTELTIRVITTEDLLKQGQEVDAGNFSLRFGYSVGKAYAEDTTNLSPDDTRHIFHKLSAWAGYYINKGDFEKARENLNNLEEQFGKYIQNKKIQIARMALYNIFSELYLRQYEKTGNKTFLDLAKAYVQKVFDENGKKYLDVPDRPQKDLEEEMSYEMRKAYDNLRFIIQKEQF